jgi:hypothetical protein
VVRFSSLHADIAQTKTQRTSNPFSIGIKVITLSSKTGLNGTVTLDLTAPAASPSASKKGSDKKSGKNGSSLYETAAPVGPSNALHARAAEPSASAVSPNWASPAASPASWAPVTWAPVTWAPVTWAPVTSSTTSAPVATTAPSTSGAPSAHVATTAPSTSGAPMIQTAASGDRLSVTTTPLELKMSGDFDIAVDDDAIFKAIEQQLMEYLTQAIPYLLTFDLDVKFEPTPATNQTLIEGADTSNVAMACLAVTMHLVSDKDGELQDFTDIVATDILCKFFQGSTLQVLLSAIVDRGVDMSFLEIVADTSSKLTVEDDVAIISESAEPQSIKEEVKSNTGYISAMIGGSCVLAIGVAAFMRVGRKQKDVDDSQDEKHHDYQEEDLEAGNDGRKNSGPTFPDLLPINFKSYVDRRRHDDDDDDSIDISLMDGPDLIASNCKDLSPLTQKSALSDAIRMNLKRMSTSSEGFECTVNGDMMFSVDLL